MCRHRWPQSVSLEGQGLGIRWPLVSNPNYSVFLGPTESLSLFPFCTSPGHSPQGSFGERCQISASKIKCLGRPGRQIHPKSHHLSWNSCYNLIPGAWRPVVLHSCVVTLTGIFVGGKKKNLGSKKPSNITPTLIWCYLLQFWWQNGFSLSQGVRTNYISIALLFLWNDWNNTFLIFPRNGMDSWRWEQIPSRHTKREDHIFSWVGNRPHFFLQFLQFACKFTKPESKKP